MKTTTNNLPCVTIDFKEAVKYGDLLSIYYDLNFTLDTLILLRKMSTVEKEYENNETKKEDETLKRALWSSSLISYARCFSTGKRLGLPNDFFNSHPDKDAAKELHKFYINMRNKNVAHSVNPFEDVQVVIVLADPKTSPKSVQGVGHLYRQRVGESIEGLNNLIILTEFANKYVEQQIKDQKNIVLEKAKIIPVDKLYSLPTNKSIIPNDHKAGQPR